MKQNDSGHFQMMEINGTLRSLWTKDLLKGGCESCKVTFSFQWQPRIEVEVECDKEFIIKVAKSQKIFAKVSLFV